MGNGTKQILLFILEEWKLLLLLTIIFCLYFYYTNSFDFFEKKGVKFMKPSILFGNLGPRFFAKQSFHEFQVDINNNFRGERFGGFFEGRRPILYLFDPELIKAVCIRDFEYFVDRQRFNSKEPRYLSRSLLNLKGSEWKAVRSTITPSFSASRLKIMLPLIEVCSQQMVEFLNQYDKSEIEMKDVLGHFTLEVIGTCAFGIKSNALEDENARFVKVAERFNYISGPKRVLLFSLLMFMPELIRFLNISFFNYESTSELMRMLKNTKTERKASNIRKNDFLQLLLDAAAKDRDENDKSKNNTCLDDDTIDAQSLLFLIAGYETSSTLLSFATYMMAVKPELQEKLRNHIEEVTEGKEISYEILSQLDYLEAFLLETLRLYPPVARVDRVCTKKYLLPDSNVHVDVGEIVSIPIYALHMNPQLYPDPKEFKPERFMNEEKKRPSHFLSFGIGPRNCIGLRFAMFTAKYAMVCLVKNFKFSTCSKTENPVQFDLRSFLLKVKNGLWVKIEKK
ncbi:cytochrome P450 9e2-like [Epargyreus clarus]|uniref:cytochrome P450 9e2-like n=1 Tax=Epargyreus clarus TaxID=520877 RepID=UPI003C2F1BBF